MPHCAWNVSLYVHSGGYSGLLVCVFPCVCVNAVSTCTVDFDDKKILLLVRSDDFLDLDWWIAR